MVLFTKLIPVHLSKAYSLREHEFEEYTAFKFHEWIGRYSRRKLCAQMHFDKMQIIILEISFLCPIKSILIQLH